MERGDLAHHHGAAAGFAGANADVISACNHVDDGIVEMQIDFDAGIQALECGKERQDVGPPERRQTGYLEDAAGRPAPVGDRRLRRFEFAQRTDASFVAGAPFFRQRQLSRRAVEQAYAELPLETLDVLAHGHRTDAELAGSGGEASRLDRLDEADQPANALHDGALQTFG